MKKIKKVKTKTVIYSKAIKANEEVHNAKEKKKAIIFNRLFMS